MVLRRLQRYGILTFILYFGHTDALQISRRPWYSTARRQGGEARIAGAKLFAQSSLFGARHFRSIDRQRGPRQGHSGGIRIERQLAARPQRSSRQCAAYRFALVISAPAVAVVAKTT